MSRRHVQPDLVARNSLSDAAAAAANWPLASKLVEETREAVPAGGGCLSLVLWWIIAAGLRRLDSDEMRWA